MSPEEIRRWRPARFAHFIGSRNRPAIERLQREVLRGCIPSPLLFVAPFGFGKTSLARLLMLALNCQRRDLVTGDPCGDCEQCRHQRSRHYNGYGSPFRRFEIDCTQFGRKDVLELTAEHWFDHDVVLFLDEIHHLHEKNSQEALLKFVEDFRGLIIAAVMADRYVELIPPLRNASRRSGSSRRPRMKWSHSSFACVRSGASGRRKSRSVPWSVNPVSASGSVPKKLAEAKSGDPRRPRTGWSPRWPVREIPALRVTRWPGLHR